MPCGAGLPQPILSATALSTAEVSRVVAQQLAPELERVLARRLRQLVHEAFDEDAFWLMFTPRQKPGGTCGLRIAWSISRFGIV